MNNFFVKEPWKQGEHGRKIHSRMIYYKQEFEQRRAGAIIAKSPLLFLGIF